MAGRTAVGTAARSVAAWGGLRHREGLCGVAFFGVDRDRPNGQGVCGLQVLENSGQLLGLQRLERLLKRGLPGGWGGGAEVG
jgi:hypothetical protein